MQVIRNNFTRTLIAFAVVVAAVMVAHAAEPAVEQGYRKLSPGTLTTIKPDRQANETFSQNDQVELQVNAKGALDWKPKSLPETSLLKFNTDKTEFHRPVWYLEFSFKPMRMIKVDFPQASGKMAQKVIWYMIYNVRNTGKHFMPAQKEDKTWEVKEVDVLKVMKSNPANPSEMSEAEEKIRFVPTFSLETIDKKKAYLDRYLPVAVEAIREREDRNRKLLSSSEMARTDIPLSTPQEDHTIWGVATWEDIDPKIDRYSVYIGGLSNAYRFTNVPGAYKEGEKPATGRIFQTKHLQLFFWRPSDEFTEEETAIYYGLPVKDAKTGVESVIDSRWIFR